MNPGIKHYNDEIKLRVKLPISTNIRLTFGDCEVYGVFPFGADLKYRRN